MEENEEVKIDYGSIAQQIADKAIGDFMSAMMPDEGTRKMCLAMFAAHHRNGVDAGTTFKILVDFGDILKEE